MALAIDATRLTRILGISDKRLGSRYLVYRACAHSSVVNDRSLVKRVRCARVSDLATREALDWQADQDEDLDEAEVIHHLHQQAKSSPLFANAISRTERSDAITTLVTSCSLQSPSLPASAQGRPLASFRRLSIRLSTLNYRDGEYWSGILSNVEKMIPDRSPRRLLSMFVTPTIVGKSLSEIEDCVVWHLQFDLVDLLSPRRLPTWRPGKRRRTTINPFHQVPTPPEQDAAPRNHPPEAKRFKGVRYRHDRRTWAAEMKPPKYKDKVSFGEFKSQAQAARAIDAAYHYYGKPHLLNFPDTPGILSTRPSPAGVLNEKDQLRFVKEQVKWLASMASTLPSSPPSVLPEILESSSRGCIGDTLGFRTFSEIASLLSCGVADESDDGTSQPLPSLPPDALAELAGSASMGPPFVCAVASGGSMGSSDEHQGMLEWSSENPLVVPSSSDWWSSRSSVQFTHVSSAPALMNLRTSAEPSCESPGLWMNYLAMSPPASMPPLPTRSPVSFHVDVTHGLLESESFGGGEWLRN